MYDNRTESKVKKVTLVRPNKVAVEFEDGRIKLVILLLFDEGIYATRERIIEMVKGCFRHDEPDTIVIGER